MSSSSSKNDTTTAEASNETTSAITSVNFDKKIDESGSSEATSQSSPIDLKANSSKNVTNSTAINNNANVILNKTNSKEDEICDDWEQLDQQVLICFIKFFC